MNRRVLVVDDSEVTRAILARALRSSGFEVLEARDAGPVAMIPGPAWRERHLDMPTVPAFAMAEILARKVAEIAPGAVAWPLRAGASEERSRRYPVEGLRLAPESRF